MPRRHPNHVPFDGDEPQVQAGDTVLVTTPHGDRRAMVATGSARYDCKMAVGDDCWLTVPVATIEDWQLLGDRATTVNWPAEHVHKP